MADEDQSGRLTEHNPANAPPPSTTGRPADMAVVTGAPRPAVLLLYLALILIGVPVWWRTTEVYRAAIPFEKLDAVSFRHTLIARSTLLRSAWCTSWTGLDSLLRE